MSQCIGACCAAFTLGGGMDSYERLRSGTVQESHEPGMVRLKDILVPLTAEEAASRIAAAGSLIVLNDEAKFTCNRWDAETKRCTVYEQRPHMCRGYPYGRKCEHGCPETGESSRVSQNGNLPVLEPEAREALTKELTA